MLLLTYQLEWKLLCRLVTVVNKMFYIRILGRNSILYTKLSLINSFVRLNKSLKMYLINSFRKFLNYIVFKDMVIDLTFLNIKYDRIFVNPLLNFRVKYN